MNSRQSKEDFVKTETGSTFIETISLQFSIPVSFFILSHFPKLAESPVWEFCIRCLPLLLVQTVYYHQHYLFYTLLQVLGIVLACILSARKLFSKSQPISPSAPTTNNKQFNWTSLVVLDRKLFLTEFRFSMMMATVVAILGVDFHIFPRTYAKTEVFGISLMDLGVGSFIFSSGLVSQTARGMKTNQSVAKRVTKMIQATLPLLLLGFARLFSVKGLDYQHNVTEYGVHWNFFFTLAFISLYVNIVDMILSKLFTTTKPNMEVIYLFATAIFVLIVHQCIMSYFELDSFILHPIRMDLFSANKEGILSLLGYLSLYYFGCGLGRAIFSVGNKSDVKKLFLLFTTLVAMLWLFHFVTLYWDTEMFLTTKTDTQLMYLKSWFLMKQNTWQSIVVPSRRFLNVGYVLWILTFNITLMWTVLVIELLSEKPILESPIRDSFARNPLSTFLVANVLTGLCNLSTNTMQVSNVIALGIMVVYLSIICLVSCNLKKRLL